MKGKQGKLRSIHIETAGNGYSVRAHHEPDADDKGMMPMGEHKPMVFSKRKHVLDHVNSMMQDHEGGEPDGDESPVPMNHPIKKLKHSMY